MLVSVFMMGTGAFIAFLVWRGWAAWRLHRDQQLMLERLAHLTDRVTRMQQDTSASLEAIRQNLAHARSIGVPESQHEPSPEPAQPPHPTESAAPPPAESLPEKPKAPALPQGTAPTAEIALKPPPPARKPPQPPAPPRQAIRPPHPSHHRKSPLELAALEILRKTWNWILFGAETRPEGVKIEFAIATTWLVRIGIVMAVVGIGFFLRESFERNLIPPAGRITLGLLAGIGLIMTGLRLLGKQYHLLGQGLIGGGLATLYFSLFASANLYGLMPAIPVFGLMAAVTLCAGVLAVCVDSPLIAILGIVGGYGTPVMLSTGEANFVGLFSYLLLLGLGIVGIAHKKNWHLLNYLGLAGTYGLSAAAIDRYYVTTDFWKVMPFLVLFFMLYSSLNYLYNVLHARKATMIELTGLVLNAGVFSHFSHLLISRAYGREWVATVSLALAAYYIIQVLTFLRRRLADRPLLLTMIGLAAFFVTITMPLLLSEQWLTVSWALQAFLVLWIGTKLDSRFICHIGYLLYAIVLGRVWFLDLGREFRAPRHVPFGQYWPDLLERLIVFGAPVASFAGACRLFKHAAARLPLAVSRENDIGEFLKTNLALRLFFLGALATGFLYLHLELNRLFLSLYTPLRHPALTLLWIGLCALLSQMAWRTNSAGLQTLFFLAIAGLLLKFAAVDLPSWNLYPHRYLYGGAVYSATHTIMRLLDFGAVIAFLFFTAATLARQEKAGNLAGLFAALATGLLFVYLTLEVNTFLGISLPGFQKGGVSLTWSLFAIACLVRGITRESLHLRLTGLALLAIVSIKIFLKDLAHLDPLYRIIAFTLLGLIVLAGSVFYLKNRQKFAIGDTEGT